MLFRFAPPTNTAIPVHVIDMNALDKWLAKQDPAVQAWVKVNGFIGAKKQALMVPGPDGAPLMALAGFGNAGQRARRRYMLAAAVQNLPEGVYTIASGLKGQMLENECFGWLLTNYQFDRYRSPNRTDRQLVAPDGIDADIRKGLINVPKDVTDTLARNFSVIALAQAGSRRAGGDPTDSIKEVSKHLAQQITKGKNAIRPWTGLALGVFGKELGEAAPLEVAEALKTQLQEERTPRIGAYAIGSGILGDPEFTEILLDKLDRIKEDEARGYICVSLGMIGASEAIVPITEIVKDSTYRPQLLQQASIALGLLGDQNVVQDLIDTLANSKSLATQAALSAALGFIGDKRSIDPLVEMLGNKNLTDRARGFAAVALGIVADKEELPWNSKIAQNLNYIASTQTLNDNAGGTGILNIL